MTCKGRHRQSDCYHGDRTWRVKAVIDDPTQSDDLSRCYGKPVERTNEITGYEISGGNWSDRQTESESRSRPHLTCHQMLTHPQTLSWRQTPLSTGSLLTEGKDRIQLGYSLLTEGNDRIQLGYSLLTEGNDRIQLMYSQFTEGNDRMQLMYSLLRERNDRMQLMYSLLTEGNHRMQLRYSLLIERNDRMYLRYNLFKEGIMVQCSQNETIVWS